MEVEEDLVMGTPIMAAILTLATTIQTVTVVATLVVVEVILTVAATSTVSLREAMAAEVVEVMGEVKAVTA